MKKPYLANYMMLTELQTQERALYDFKSQISYTDNGKENKVIDFNAKNANSTIVTETIECSDPDEINMGGMTLITKTIEASDPDEFLSCGFTVESRVIESSDIDEILNINFIGATKETFTIENSDLDELIM